MHRWLALAALLALALSARPDEAALGQPGDGPHIGVKAGAEDSSGLRHTVQTTPVSHGLHVEQLGHQLKFGAVLLFLAVAGAVARCFCGAERAAPMMERVQDTMIKHMPAQAGAPTALQSQKELSGRRRSLLIGINYAGTNAELSGCINDIGRIRPLLGKLGFPSDNESQLVLVDEPSWPADKQPTLANMRAAFRWLAEGAKAGDSLFFHYSGHGGRRQKTEGSEDFTESLIPVDYQKAGVILDTEMFDILVRPLPDGCRLTCILDCCHSAGALNLPYLFVGTEENLRRALAGEAVKVGLSQDWSKSMEKWNAGDRSALLADMTSMGKDVWRLWQHGKDARGGNVQTDEAQNVGVSVGHVIAISGCRSDQTSADVRNVGQVFRIDAEEGSLEVDEHRALSKAGGALTSVLIEVLQDLESKVSCSSLTYLTLLERIRQRLEEKGFKQVPQIALSLVIELHQCFSLSTIFAPA